MAMNLNKEIEFEINGLKGAVRPDKSAGGVGYILVFDSYENAKEYAGDGEVIEVGKK